IVGMRLVALAGLARLQRSVARGGGPDRVRQTGELAAHPEEFLCVPEGLLLRGSDMASHEITAIGRAALEADLRGDVVVEFPRQLGLVDRGVEAHIGIAVPRGE